MSLRMLNLIVVLFFLSAPLFTEHGFVYQSKAKTTTPNPSSSSKAPEGAEKIGTQESSKNAAVAERKSALERFSGNISAVRSIAIDFLLLGLLIAFLAAAVWEMRRKLVIVELVEVPEDLSKKGYTPTVIAQRIVAEITSLRRAARFRGRLEEGLEIDSAQIDFTVPTAGISYRNTIRYARQLFRRHEERISGEIVHEGKKTRIVLRTRGGRTTSSSLYALKDAELNDLLQSAALEIAMLVDPYLVATYWLWKEQRLGTFEKTLAAIRKCLADTPQRAHYNAYVIWGNVLFFQKEFAEAEQKYRMAFTLSPKKAAIFNSWGNLLRAHPPLTHASPHTQFSIPLDSKNLSALNNLANVCNDRRQHREAVRFSARAI